MKKNYIFFLFFLAFTFTSYAEKFYVDPVNGDISNNGTINSPWSTLEEVINANYITSQQYNPLPYDPNTSNLIIKNPSGYVKANDTIVLMNGLHGELFLSSYINSSQITIMGMENHNPIVKKVHMLACKNWKLQNIKISSEPYGTYISDKLVFIESHGWQGPTSNIEIDQCDVYSTDSPWTTASEWINNMSDGIYISANDVKVTNTTIRNTDFGLIAEGDFIEANNNQVINFAGDAMRMIGSNISFKYNLIKNCYKVNDNHDDGIQSWAEINGVVADDNEVIGNTIINTDDPNRALNGPLQGIGCFDGFYNRWKVINNLVLVDHWHGITFLGARDCEIYNNTVLDLTINTGSGPSWIMIDDHKNGNPSTGCIIANNVSNSLDIDGQSFNNITLSTFQDYTDNFVDYANYDFHLLSTSSLVDAANATYAPLTDIEDKARPYGNNPDIGAYEYYPSLSVSENELSNYNVYPNPFSDFVYIEGNENNFKIEIRNLLGQLMYEKFYDASSTPKSVNTSALKKGIYFLIIQDENSKKYQSVKLIK